MPELETLIDDVSQAMVSDVAPERLEAFDFASQILPAFSLLRGLVSQSPLDTCLKLMLLYELTRAGGRFSLQRIRTIVGFLEPARVEALVRSLKDSGWLELRAVDQSYTVSPHGLNLLAVLYAADIGNLTPANALARAAQNAAFGATLDGAEGATAYLLDQLLTLLQDQVDEARLVLQRGRPYRLIAWNQRRHGRQLEVIKQVLAALQERMDASSREFSRVVRLHEAMQEIIRLHAGIHTRLRAWNLERLYSSDSGYSIPQLVEAVLGMEEEACDRLRAAQLLQLPVRPPALSMDELRSRFHGARRRSLRSRKTTSTHHPRRRPWTPSRLRTWIRLPRSGQG